MTETYNPFVQIIKSFEGYVHTKEFFILRKQRTAGKIICALIVTLILNIITFGVGAGTLCTSKNVSDFIESIPDFYYVSGELTVTEKYEANEDSIYIIVDTDIPYYYSGGDNGGHSDAVSVDSTVSALRDKGGMQQALFISSTNFLQVNFVSGQVQSLTFDELSKVFPIKTLSKQMVQEGYKGFIIKWAIIIGLIYLPFQLAGLFFTTLLYSLVALLAKSLLKKDYDYNTLYWITFYMYIPLVILKALLKIFISYDKLINVAAFMFLSGMIIRVLMGENALPGDKKEGTPYAMPQASPSAFDPNSDLDSYMQETESANADTAFSDSANNSTDNYFNMPDTTGSSTGLSLKSDDE